MHLAFFYDRKQLLYEYGTEMQTIPYALTISKQLLLRKTIKN